MKLPTKTSPNKVCGYGMLGRIDPPDPCISNRNHIEKSWSILKGPTFVNLVNRSVNLV